MTTNSLPISRLINVAVNLSPLDAQAQDISTLLILSDTAIIDTLERYRIYSGIDEIATDFGTSAAEYLAAVPWFEQAPKPVKLLIGRWAKAASKAQIKGAPLTAAQQLMSAWTSITTPKFKITVDGGAAEDITVGSFAAVTNLNGVAALINTALDTAHTGMTCVWNSVYERFEITGATTGATATLSFLSTPATGTDISDNLKMLSTDSGAYVVDGIAAETLADSIALFDDNYGQKWYALNVIGASVEEDLTAADYIEAATNKHLRGFSTDDPATLLSTSSTDLASLLKAGNYKRSVIQYSSDNPYAVNSLLGRILTTNYNENNSVITLMYKQEPGIVAETLSSSQIAVLNDKRCNVFVAYNNDTAIIEQGKVASGEFLDVIIGTDWLALQIQTGVYNLLYTNSTKVPQTDAGTNLIVTVIEGILALAVSNGLLAPGVWTSGGFGSLKSGDFIPKGYYVYAPKVSTQLLADRAARKSVPIQIAAKLAGAVHTVDITINVNR